MLTRQLMTSITNAELERALYAEFDELTATDVEIELRKRFSALVASGALTFDAESIEEMVALKKAIDNSSAVDAMDLSAMVPILGEFNVESPKDLRRRLEASRKFFDIAAEAGDVITRLSDLINEQE